MFISMLVFLVSLCVVLLYCALIVALSIPFLVIFGSLFSLIGKSNISNTTR